MTPHLDRTPRLGKMRNFLQTGTPETVLSCACERLRANWIGTKAWSGQKLLNTSFLHIHNVYFPQLKYVWVCNEPRQRTWPLSEPHHNALPLRVYASDRYLTGTLHFLPIQFIHVLLVELIHLEKVTFFLLDQPKSLQKYSWIIEKKTPQIFGVVLSFRKWTSPERCASWTRTKLEHLSVLRRAKNPCGKQANASLGWTILPLPLVSIVGMDGGWPWLTQTLWQICLHGE